MMSRLLVLLCAVAATGCADLGGVSRDEVARVRSPSGRVDAVLVETNGGATTSFGYEVYLTPAEGAPGGASAVATLYGAVRNDSAYGANMRWDGPNTLLVEYLDTRSAEIVQPEATIGGEKVRTLLQGGVRDPNAPGGGMLYNLSRSSR